MSYISSGQHAFVHIHAMTTYMRKSGSDNETTWKNEKNTLPWKSKRTISKKPELQM